MGQVASHISGFFTDKQKDKSKLDVEEDASLEKDYYSLKSQNHENKENVKSFLSFGIEATPRRHLKRSRQISPTGPLPQSILNIISPPKKPRIEDEYLDFAFLNDSTVVKYFKKSKIMIILRGLPGSGKTTISKHIQRKYVLSNACSADFFFMKDGEYTFDGDLIKDAHAQCKENAIKAVQDQTPVIVIDNTNLKLWEMKFYFELANKFNYIPLVIESQTPWRNDPTILASKNTHNISQDSIEFKVNNYEDLIPLYYGWFLNEADSLALFEVGQVWLERIFELPQFQKHFLRLTGVMYVQEFLDYFRKPHEGFVFHCTAQYIGKRSTPEALEYIEKSQTSVGKVFDIEIVGFVLTPRTFGARIKLSPEQLQLWAKDDYEDVPAEYWYVDYEEDDGCPGGDMQVKNGDDGVNCNGNTDKGQNSSGVIENDFISNGASEKEMPNLTNGNDIIPNGNDKDHNLSDVHETNESIHDISNKESKNSPEVLTLNSSSESYPDISEDVTFQLANHNDQIKQNGTSTPIINDKETPDKSPSQTKNKLSPSQNKSAPIEQNGHTTKDSSPHNRSWISKSKSKSPRKPKGNLPIPDNEMDIADTSTRETFVSSPNENSEGKFPLTHGQGSRAHFTLGCAPHIKPVTTGLDLILAIRKEEITHGRTELDLNELYKEKERELSAKTSSKEDETPLSYCSFVEGGTIMNYGNGVWVIYPEEKLVAKSVFAAKF